MNPQYMTWTWLDFELLHLNVEVLMAAATRPVSRILRVTLKRSTLIRLNRPGPPPQAPFSPSLSPLQMFNNMSLDATLSSSHYTQYPSANLPSLSPVFSLLDFSDCGHRELSLEDNSDASSAHSPFESGPPLLLFDPAQLPPRVVFHSEADHPTVSAHSRTYSDITTGSNDRLTAPPFRRHSFNTQRSRATFFWPENGSSTPDTPSSPFPSSDYLFRHPQVAQQSAASFVFFGGEGTVYPAHAFISVASPAGVHAANLRRKKQAKFRCKYCQATLTTKHNLTNHLNSHEGKRPYACGLCGATFGTISVKKRHQKNCKGLVATH
ncbi:hypothetical protein MVEN_02135400 [Mycena venus]|uniref:C2H2-type domain-containing protein n=1 Tax=Mycena venus TaxID=2733690 RepID=A0A8H6XA39_9AGAR|nr:hypothetical protein MVEN_02135400 [Mycena venus]